MAALQNILQQLYDRIAEVPENEQQHFGSLVSGICEQAIRQVHGQQKAIVTSMLERIAPDDVIMTHSLSSTVRQLFQRLAETGCQNRVIVTESRPGNEGTVLAELVADLGISVTFITDAEIDLFVPRVDKVILGADTVLADGSVINKVGTVSMALSASYHGVPVYVCAESFKQKADNEFRLEEMAAEELDFVHPGVEVRNIYFERLPAELITCRIDENTALSTTEMVG
jgi:translation initiation factor 2B subunit (eIF-2B alpha/beta/delta family)